MKTKYTPEEVEKMRAEMKRAVRYRDGPGQMNVIYLGSMASATLAYTLGGNMTDDLQKLIDDATEIQIIAGFDYPGFQWILKHYRDAGSKLYKFKIVKEEIN